MAVQFNSVYDVILSPYQTVQIGRYIYIVARTSSPSNVTFTDHGSNASNAQLCVREALEDFAPTGLFGGGAAPAARSKAGNVKFLDAPGTYAYAATRVCTCRHRSAYISHVTTTCMRKHGIYEALSSSP